MKCSLMVALSIIALSTGLFSQVQALRPNPLIGTWKQNMEKSTYSPGPPPLKGSSVDPYTVKIVQKEDDKIVSVSTRTISRDGKTMTDRFDYMDAGGQHVTNVLVFEKQ